MEVLVSWCLEEVMTHVNICIWKVTGYLQNVQRQQSTFSYQRTVCCVCVWGRESGYNPPLATREMGNNKVRFIVDKGEPPKINPLQMKPSKVIIEKSEILFYGVSHFDTWSSVSTPPDSVESRIFLGHFVHLLDFQKSSVSDFLNCSQNSHYPLKANCHECMSNACLPSLPFVKWAEAEHKLGLPRVMRTLQAPSCHQTWSWWRGDEDGEDEKGGRSSLGTPLKDVVTAYRLISKFSTKDFHNKQRLLWSTGNIRVISWRYWLRCCYGDL